MTMIVDNAQKKKHDKYNINIKTKYIVNGQILERNSNHSKNDDIKNGIRFCKEYYVNNQLKHTENEFDSRIEYTFISSDELSKEHKCPNCSMKYKLNDTNEACPYCGTYYNMEYVDKDLGSKYHYDRVLRSNVYRIITAVIDLIVSLIICFLFLKATSRTFNAYDVSKVFIYGIILALILYYFFYIIDAYVVLGPIKKYKDRENKKQREFWIRTKINKKEFFNNFNYEIRNYYYNKDFIVDYDVIDYLKFNEYQKDNNLYVKVLVLVRKVEFTNNKFVSKIKKELHTMKKVSNESLKLKGGANIIKCHNCGASIDVLKNKCEYCDTKMKYYQEWILVKD